MCGGYNRLTEKRLSIAELLKENGYTAAAFYTNSWLSRVYSYHRGFETSEEFVTPGPKREIMGLMKRAWRILVKKLPMKIRRSSLNREIKLWGMKISAERLTQKAIR